MQLDLQTGRQLSIDGRGSGDRADADLDAALGDAFGQDFSTKELQQVASQVRRYLRAARPRAPAKMLLFLYPGRISRSGLNALREIAVDIELIVKPCARTVCNVAVGRHLDVLGRSMGSSQRRAGRHLVRFGRISVHTTTQFRRAERRTLTFSAAEVIKAGKSAGGAQLIRQAQRARADYPRRLQRRLMRQARSRRLRFDRSPRIARHGQTVDVALWIKSDRVRVRSDVMAALRCLAHALGAETGPQSGEVVVSARVSKREPPRRFHSTVAALIEHASGKLSTAELWSSYVGEQRRDARRMSFATDDDAEPADRPDRTPEILAAKTAAFAPCLTRELRINPKFRSTTLDFAITRLGSAHDLKLSGAGASLRLKSCLAKVLSRIRFGRIAAPRRVRYPLSIQP